MLKYKCYGNAVWWFWTIMKLYKQDQRKYLTLKFKYGDIFNMPHIRKYLSNFYLSKTSPSSSISTQPIRKRWSFIHSKLQFRTKFESHENSKIFLPDKKQIKFPLAWLKQNSESNDLLLFPQILLLPNP